MSFILDALKKSESDRQRQTGPSLFEVKVAPPRRRLPIWAIAIAVLLLINVVIVSWMLLRRPATQQPAAPLPTPAAAAPASAATSVTAASSSPPKTGVPAALDQAASAPAADPKAPPAAAAVVGDSNPHGGQTAAGGGNASDYAPAVEPAAPAGSASAGSSSGDDLPLYQQIVANDNLPPLHLDLHVYAERPRDRFAMINMHRVAEGDSLPSGAQVEAIRPDGVVLSYRGTRFLLPRN